MNSQEHRNLQEAYLNVYENEQLDEMPYRVVTKNDGGEEVYVGGKYTTRKTARTKVNKEDERVGGYRHSIRKVDESATRIAPKIRGAKDDVKYMDGRSPGGMSISGNSQVSGAGYMRRGGGVQTQPNPNMPPVNSGRMDSGTRIDLKYRQAQLKAKGGSSSSAGAGSASRTTGRDKYQVGGGEGYGVLGIKLANSYEPDLFDVILEYLLDGGYADTNENALVIMVNMSEDWRESIIERKTDPLKTAAENSKKRNDAYGSKKFKKVVDDSPSNPRSKNFNPNSLKTPGV